MGTLMVYFLSTFEENLTQDFHQEKRGKSKFPQHGHTQNLQSQFLLRVNAEMA